MNRLAAELKSERKKNIDQAKQLENQLQGQMKTLDQVSGNKEHSRTFAIFHFKPVFSFRTLPSQESHFKFVLPFFCTRLH